MRNELNRIWTTAPRGKSSKYRQVTGCEASEQAASVLPMLDWPKDLFSRFIAEVTDEPEFMAA